MSGLPQRVLVAGATGHIGRRLVAELVVTINRRPAANVPVSFAVSLPGRPPQATKLDPTGVSG